MFKIFIQIFVVVVVVDDDVALVGVADFLFKGFSSFSRSKSKAEIFFI